MRAHMIHMINFAHARDPRDWIHLRGLARADSLSMQPSVATLTQFQTARTSQFACATSPPAQSLSPPARTPPAARTGTMHVVAPHRIHPQVELPVRRVWYTPI